jgi:hypothetical protein
MSDDLKALLDEAAERGAEAALRKIGLHDEHAGRDIQEVRDLLYNWRETKKTIAHTVAKVITTAILAVIALGTWQYMDTK